MTEPKEYEITSFDDLMDVATPENVDRLAADLSKWLKHSVSIYAVVKGLNPDLKDKKNSELAKCGFTWVDDGKNNLLETRIIIEEP